jgi:RNA polymerase sigma-70 factor (ECF subfamily)
MRVREKLDMTPLTDEALMNEIQNGCTDALTTLFQRYSRLVFDIVLRILRDRGEAEDVTQEVFIEIYQKAHLYDSRKGTVKTWLFQYAYHRSFNRRKYLALRGLYYGQALPQPELRATSKAHDPCGSIDFRDVLQNGMKKLSDRERQIIELVVLHGWTLREVSTHVQQSYTNSRNIYYRGIRKLKAIGLIRGQTSKSPNYDQRCSV